VNSAVACFSPWTCGRSCNNSDLRSRFDIAPLYYVVLLNSSAVGVCVRYRTGVKWLFHEWRKLSWQIGECSYTPMLPPKQ
jgi:hypothetical protein